MQALSASDIVSLWEIGLRPETVDKGLLLLAASHPDLGHDEIYGLILGRRNLALLDLRAGLFGRMLHARVHCPSCNERLEFTVDQFELARSLSQAAEPVAGRIQVGDWHVHLRVALCNDLAAISKLTDPQAARRALIGRVVQSASRAGVVQSVDDLPDEIIAAVEAALDEADPAAAPALQMTCAGCEHEWAADLDIATFLWSEIAVLAQRLLDEVDLLARSYGWSEAAILSLSAARRRHYLNCVTA